MKTSIAASPYPAREHADCYAQYLGCVCHFGQEHCELVYDSAILDRKPQLAHHLTATLLQETCERLIGEAQGVRRHGRGRLSDPDEHAGRFAPMDDVAAAVNVTTRTLRRRLLAENTSFAKILDDVRSSLALEYLKTTKMSADDIATLLGFNDSAAFREALRRWTGQGLGALRGRHRL